MTEPPTSPWSHPGPEYGPPPGGGGYPSGAGTEPTTWGQPVPQPQPYPTYGASATGQAPGTQGAWVPASSPHYHQPQESYPQPSSSQPYPGHQPNPYGQVPSSPSKAPLVVFITLGIVLLALAVTAAVVLLKPGSPASSPTTTGPTEVPVTTLAPPTATASSETPTRTPTPSPTLATPSFTLNPNAPVVNVTVARGKPWTMKGDTSTQVVYTVQGGGPIIMKLQCTSCTNPSLRIDDSDTDFARTFGSPNGEWAIARKDEKRTGLITMMAKGTWTLTLTSLFDLPAQAPPVTTTGSKVLHLTGTATSIRVRAPKVIGGMWCRSYDERTGEVGWIFGTEHNEPTYDDTLKVKLPAYVSCNTGSTWTVSAGG